MPDVAWALVWLWIFNPLYGPLNLTLERLGLPSPSWLSDPDAARWAVIVMTAFTLGEAFVIVLAVRASLPRELYELAAVEGAGAWWGVTRVTLPLIAPVLALLLLRDTIFTFQLNFVPGADPHRRRAAALRHDLPAALRVPRGLRVPPLRLRGRGDARDVRDHGGIVWVQWLLLRRWRASFAI